MEPFKLQVDVITPTDKAGEEPFLLDLIFERRDGQQFTLQDVKDAIQEYVDSDEGRQILQKSDWSYLSWDDVEEFVNWDATNFRKPKRPYIEGGHETLLNDGFQAFEPTHQPGGE